MGKSIERYGAPPLFYADQPAEMMLGPFTTRITFGVAENDDSDFPRPVVTLAMPTEALRSLAEDILKQIDAPSFKKQRAQTLLRLAESLLDGGSGKSPPALKMVRKPVGKRAPKLSE
ncbi:hypothetical protein [Mitsuaria sp. 7]|uniref:hypothetical protein n=1 Tax=Mitsuaria sp. 7 TaxID=1658665 RepID=UPI0012FCD388|nr:hypothetical protein [Mitsuaria sp. 7]